MFNNAVKKLAGVAAVLCVANVAPPAMAQYYTYVNPRNTWSDSYYVPYNGYGYNSSYYYDDYRPRSATRSALKGAAVGGLAGLGVSLLSGRHNRNYARNIGIGAVVGAGVGLLGNYLDRRNSGYYY